MSQLLCVLAAVVTGGDPEIAANIAANATQYNYLSHSDLERASKELLGCGNDTTCAEDGYAKYRKLSMEQTAQALVECGNDPKTCANVSMLVAKAEADTARFKNIADTAFPAVAKVLNLLIAENYGFQNELAGVTANAATNHVGSNSGSGWAAQIKIGNKLLGQDGALYRRASNTTHIPVDF